MKVKKDKVKLITLGCSKNLVDSEHILAHLVKSDIEITQDENLADTVVINTCGFIDEAKQESIDTILKAVRLKTEGRIKNIYVAGCLSDRYKDQLEKEIPEVDKYFGATDKQKTVADILNTLGADYKRDLIGERLVTTPPHFAYLKISEGCNNPCSFCAIPIMRGTHVSKPLQSIASEAQMLGSKGTKEIIVIGQDTTYWGFDTDKKRNLSDVLKTISNVRGVEWIRLMYAYPSRFPIEILETIRETPNIAKYIDIPIQHVTDNVLKSMRRGITKRNLISVLERIRNEVPGIAIRTTVIVGYPDETEQDFNELLEFVKEFRFDRLGVFMYSHEESTVAYGLPDRIPTREKKLRQKLISDAQKQISLENNQETVGKVLKVMIDREEKDYYIGRTEKDAPEIDQEVHVNKDKQLYRGGLYDVEIYDYEEFDLFGQAK